MKCRNCERSAHKKTGELCLCRACLIQLFKDLVRRLEPLGADRTANILDGALEDIRLLKSGFVAVVWLGADGVEITADIDPARKEVHWGIEANTAAELAALAQELKAKKGVDLQLKGRKT